MEKTRFPFRIRPVFAFALGLSIGMLVYTAVPGAFRIALLALGAALSAFGLVKKDPVLSGFAIGLTFGTLRAAFPAAALPGRLTESFSALSQTLGERIDGLFPEWPGVARGMLLGGKNASIEHALKDRLYDIGIGHLLAVSGLHVSVLAGTLTVVWRRGALGLRYLFLAAFLFSYCCISGMSPSVIRASVMMLYATPITAHAKRRDSLVSVSLACAVVLLWDPSAPGSASFLLSFGSVLGILLLSAPAARALSFLPEKVASSLSVTLAATLMTAPIVAFMFGEISALGLIANLVILPFVPFFLIPAFFITLLSFIWPDVVVLAVFPRAVLWVIMTLANAGASPVIRVSAPGVLTVVFYYAAVLTASDYCLLKPKRKYPAALFLMLAALCLWVTGL